ncbi:MAG: hypothetical protein AAGU75_02735 [Bacillota bacterium]
MKTSIGGIDMNKKYMLVNLILTTIITFLLLFIGIRVVLNNSATIQNIVSMFGFSLIIAFISTAMYHFKLKLAYCFFNLGILIGMIQMYLLFFKDMDGWGDLTGLASLFVWIFIGFVVGLIVQFGYYLYNKYRRKKL